MLFLALAVGVAVGAADDDEWRPKDEKKSTPVRSLSDDWEEDAAAKRATRPVKPSLRQIGAEDDFDKDGAKAEKWHGKPTMTTKPQAKPQAKKAEPASGDAVKADVKASKMALIMPEAKLHIDPSVKKTAAVADEGDDALPILGESRQPPKEDSAPPKSEPNQPPPEGSESTKPAAKLPELPKGLGSQKTPKVIDLNSGDAPKSDEPAPKIQKGSDLPTPPKPVAKTPMDDVPPPAPKPMTQAPTTAPSAKSVEAPMPPPKAIPPVKSDSPAPSVVTPKPSFVRDPVGSGALPPPASATPIPSNTIPPDMQAVPKIAPAPTTKVDMAPAPKVMIETPPPTQVAPPGTTAASPPVLMEHTVVGEDSANICMPLMEAASCWRFETRSFLIWWDQPGTAAFVTDHTTGETLVGGGDYDFETRFAQELSLERRFDAASAMVIRGLVTEDARVGVGAIGFGGLDLGIGGPGSGNLRGLSGFTGRATSRLWKVDVDFVQHFLKEPDSPIRGRLWVGPQFIGLHETYAYHAEGAAGSADFDARTQNTLFGGDVGGGVTFQPWYSNLGIDVSGRYGFFGNVFDIRNDFAGPGGVFVAHGDDGNSRFATAFELNVEATLRIARNVWLLGGWRLWNIQGVGRAVAQVPTTTANTTLATSGDRNLFAHGLFLGASVGWGGSADPNSRYGGARPYVLREQ